MLDILCMRVLTKKSTFLSRPRNQKVLFNLLHSSGFFLCAVSALALTQYATLCVFIFEEHPKIGNRGSSVWLRAVHSLQHIGRLGLALAVERGKCFAARNATRDAVSWPSNEEGCTRRALFIASSATDTVRAYKKDRNRQNACGSSSETLRDYAGVWTRAKLNYVHDNGAER